MTKFRLSGLTGLLMFALAATVPAFGQAVDSSKGAIVVEVQDSTGAVVPGAAVTLKGPVGRQEEHLGWPRPGIIFHLGSRRL